MNKKSLDLLFKPRNIAIFEAKEKFGYFIEGFKQQGYNLEKLFLVSPAEEEISGINCYKSIDDIPDNAIDLLILAVRRELLMPSLEEITSKKKINFIHIFTAGTGEFDDIGVKIEKQLKNFFDNHTNIKAIGPNCMGIYCPGGKTAYLPRFPLDDGNIGLIYHSGDLHSRVIMYGYSRYQLTFSKGVSIGNCVSLQVTDFLEYFENDNDIDIISVYFEGFSKYQESAGKKLLTILKKIKKPILFLRGGMTDRAQSAVQTHTGSLGSDERIWEGVFKQTPLIEVGSSLDEMVDYLFIFHSFFKKYRDLIFEERIKYFPKGNNVLVIMWSGGLGILNTDTLTKLGFNLPLFESEIKQRLMEIYPIKVGSLNNPLDLPWISRSEKYVELCKAAITENIDLIIMHTNAFGYEDKERFERYYNNLKEIRDHIESLNKILILILADTPTKIRNDYYQLLIDANFIVYPSIERGAKSFSKLYEFGKKIERLNKELN
ncbi:MAG: CoA-binding protein [Candidatus Hodarchaeota archaeon]